jgi:hypothetical protein
MARVWIQLPNSRRKPRVGAAVRVGKHAYVGAARSVGAAKNGKPRKTRTWFGIRL